MVMELKSKQNSTRTAIGLSELVTCPETCLNPQTHAVITVQKDGQITYKH